MKNAIFAVFLTALSLFAMQPVAHAASVEKIILGNMINNATNKFQKLGGEIANSNCKNGATKLAGAFYLFDNHNSGIEYTYNNVGLVLAILKASDPQTYQVVRGRVVSGKADTVRNVLAFDEKAMERCDNRKLFKDVVYESIVYNL